MKFESTKFLGATALALTLLCAPPLLSMDHESEECRRFCAEIDGADDFVAQARRNKFFGELDTPEKKAEVATRFRQYAYVRTRYYELEAKIKFLGLFGMLHARLLDRLAGTQGQVLSDQLLRRAVSELGDAEIEKFGDYAFEFLGTRTPTVPHFRKGLETATIPFTLSLIRKTFYKIAMQQHPVSRSWLQMEPAEVKAIHDLTIAALYAEARPTGEMAVLVSSASLDELRPRVAKLLQKPSVPSGYKPELRDHLAYLTTFSLPPEDAFAILVHCLEDEYP
ncbi:MAG: hypothetical protein H6617_07845 [Bdellovibrionaceae bacterium]|nr:hypothetical protein [Pseudobdellovibrionaceae bacterium]